MNPLELRDQRGPSETIQNGWIRLCDSIFQETKTRHKISSRNSTMSIQNLVAIIFVSPSFTKLTGASLVHRI